MTLSELLANPTTFFQAVTGYSPHDYQSWLLNQDLRDGARIALLLSRRTGKSVTVAIKILYEALTTTQRNFRVLIVAPSSEQSSIIYEAIRDALYHPCLTQLCLAYEKKTGRKLTFNERKCEVPNNRGKGLSSIALLSGDTRGGARYQVGQRADLFVCDESSLIADSTYYKLREVRRTGNYRAEILLSTPRQTDGFFYSSCRPVTDDWQYNSEWVSASDYKVCHRDVEHCPHIRGVPDIWEEVQQDMQTADTLDVEQEFYAHFTAGFGRFFSHTDVVNCLSKEIKPWSEYRDKKIILTIDLAIEQDESVALWLAADGHSHLTVIHAESFRRNPDNPETRDIDSMEDICRLVKTYKDRGLIPYKAYVDASKDGSFPDLLTTLTGIKSEAIIWGPKTKTDLMFSLRESLRAGQFSLPDSSKGYHARQLVSQLMSYDYDVTAAGNYQFNIKQGLKGRVKKFKDDYVSSLAMATEYLSDGCHARPYVAKVGGKKQRQWDYLSFSNRETKEMQAVLSL